MSRGNVRKKEQDQVRPCPPYYNLTSLFVTNVVILPGCPPPFLLQALACGDSVVYNNAYDTRRTVPVERSDVVALQHGHISISTLQVGGGATGRAGRGGIQREQTGGRGKGPWGALVV